MTIKRLMTCCLTLSLGLTLSAISHAQEEEVGEEVQTGVQQVEMAVIDGEGLGAPMIFSTTRATTGDGAGAVRINALPAMSFMGTDGSGVMMGSPDPFSLLGDPSVQKDLELVGDQLQQIKDLQQDFSRQMREQIGDLSKGGLGPERFKGIGELVKQLREKQKNQMQDLLLPHQIERLQQVALQQHMSRAGTAGALASKKVAEALGITDEQQERLKQREKEIKEEVAKKMAKIREDARNELLQELTAKQREQLKQMTGDKYKSNASDWREQFQQRIEKRRIKPAKKGDYDS